MGCGIKWRGVVVGGGGLLLTYGIGFNELRKYRVLDL